MTAVATLTGALSTGTMTWYAIDWYAVYRTVRRLQARSVKAVQAGRWGKVHALQHLLTHSFSGKVLAVKRVTDNDGKKTPGVDGVVWDTPEETARGSLPRLPSEDHQTDGLAQPSRRLADLWRP